MKVLSILLLVLAVEAIGFAVGAGIALHLLLR